MNIKEDKGLILIIIGLILTCTIFLFFIGIPLIIIGTYLLNKKVNQKEKELDNKLKDKKEELANIDVKLEELEKEKEKEINDKLKQKQDELDVIDVRLEEKAKKKEIEINKKLNDKKEELENIETTLEKMEQDKQKEINALLEDKKNELDNIDKILEEKEKESEKQINIKLENKNNQLFKVHNEIEEKKKELGLLDEEVEMQIAGIYKPKYKFITSVAYKEKLDEIRNKQKSFIKNKTAAICGTDWELNRSKQKGKALTNANIKQILRNFNLECEMIINKVKLSTRESSINRINKAFETLNKLNERNDIKIQHPYLNLKLEELDIAIEYELKKQEEKEILREERARQAEERKIQKQLDVQEKKINKTKEKTEKELNDVEKQLKNANDEEKEKLEEEIKKLKLALEKSNKDMEQISNKRKRTGAGYVYILSNIGSFGENIYKIGVTRRDDPMGRVTELSDASVPFRFDHHVFIFSEEAFELERELHNRFDDKRVNRVNMRKEFFHITIDDVKKIVEENKDIVHSFQEHPEAQEYYDTLKIGK